MPRRTYALVKIKKLSDLELAEALDEYDAAFAAEAGAAEIAEEIEALLRYHGQR